MSRTKDYYWDEICAMQPDPNDDFAPPDEMSEAMDEYYNKPVTVTCSYCKLSQTATTSQLVDTGWTLEPDDCYCFQAWCKRERAGAEIHTCQLCNKPNRVAGDHPACQEWENFMSDAKTEASNAQH